VTAPHVGDFVRRVGPLVHSRETAKLLAELDRSWPVSTLVHLLDAQDPVVVCAAAVCLGHTAGQESVPALRALLAHEHDEVVAAAENSLWSVWMRAAGAEACAALAGAVANLEAGKCEAAIRTLRSLVAAHPEFAEAHHQLALAMHTLGLSEPAEASYETAYRLNPAHYAAAANLGHVAVERSDYVSAYRWYRASLSIHPRQPELQAIVPRLAAALDRRVVA